MSLTATLFVAGLAVAALAQAQDRIYRCGNEYTNTVSEPGQKGCKLLDGGNVTVVQRQRPAPVRVASAGQAGARVDTAEQRASATADARLILESELNKAEARQAELLKEYNNGEPEKLGPETATTRSTWTAWPNSRPASRATRAIWPASAANSVASCGCASASK